MPGKERILKVVGRGLGRGLALVCLVVAACVSVPTATAAGPTLAAGPSPVAPGGSVSVSWSGVAAPTTTDWVGLFRQGAADTASVWWFYTSTCSSAIGTAKASGSCSLNFPGGAGTYEFRLFAKNGYTRLATSGAIVVSDSATPPPTSPTLVATPSSVAPGGSVSVSWAGLPAPTATDWVGVYRQGAADTAAVWWFYTSTCSSAVGTAKASGSCPLTMPASEGTYELRLFSQNGWTRIATSGSIVVGGLPSGSGSSDPVLLAAGDIASCDTQGDEQTAAILGRYPTAAIATLGDNAYPHGTAAAFQNCYAPSWGQFRDRTHPAVGNHDYDTAGASGYFGYFGSAAGDPKKGWYSYDLGDWHVVVLNSNCSEVGGCGAGSAQEQWLRADLAAHPSTCTLAYWHHPRFTSGWVGNDAETATLWGVLQSYGADLVMSGHAHNYERFAPQNSSGAADPAGLREIVVGTGGEGLEVLGARAANSVVVNAVTLGVLKLTLHPTSYDWDFLPVAGQTFTDAGSAECNVPDTSAPSVSLTAPAAASTVSGTVQMTASASDDVGVAKVEFLVGGTVVATDTTAPYAASWDSTMVANGQVQLAARATDAAGNTTTSPVATVTVQNVAPAGPTLTVTPSSVDAGGSVTVSWSGVTSPAAADWVGVFLQGAGNGSYVRWFYTSTCGQSTGAAKAAGSCALAMPTSPGTYELRLFRNNGSTVLVTSGPVVVGGSSQSPPSPPSSSSVTLTATPSTVSKGGYVTVTWSGVATPSPTDWVGLYRQGAADTASSAWLYTSTCSSKKGTAKAAGSCQLRVPKTTGTYELRLFANDGYTRMATSQTFVVS